MSDLIFEKLTAVKLSDEVNELVYPLLKYFQITYFGYIKVYEDNSHVMASNNYEWGECFYKNFFHQGVYHKPLDSYESGYSLWSQQADQSITHVMRTDFNIDHGITIVRKEAEFCEFFIFATRPENHGIVNWYINNLNLLEAFVLSFKENGSKIIQSIEKDRFLLPGCVSSGHNDELQVFSSDFTHKAQFLQEIKSKQNNMQDHSIITQREWSCIKLIIQGYSAKEAAQSLKLSFRTVEGYLNNIKNKLGVRNTAEMIAKLFQMKFL